MRDGARRGPPLVSRAVKRHDHDPVVRGLRTLLMLDSTVRQHEHIRMYYKSVQASYFYYGE
jgi:hypothetical protein